MTTGFSTRRWGLKATCVVLDAEVAFLELVDSDGRHPEFTNSVVVISAVVTRTQSVACIVLFVLVIVLGVRKVSALFQESTLYAELALRSG